MCFAKVKSLFTKKKPVQLSEVVEPATHRALFFAINDYKGKENDLHGCINDQNDFIKMLNALFPGYDIRAFKDSQVTIQRVLSELVKAIRVLREGDFLFVHYSGHGTQVIDQDGDETDNYDEAIYVYDGYILDDTIGTILQAIPKGAFGTLMFDSCFSETMDKALHESYFRNRYMITDHIPINMPKRIRTYRKNADKNYIIISGCRENQTSADALIDGRHNGALTAYALKELQPGITWEAWIKKVIKDLEKNKYDQIPTIEGPSNLLKRKVFI